ncbi:polyphosphate--nucleotide phosphotransferase [Rhodoferax koreense]|uniref:Polyphosphate--nucleotide phosphotransferase n=1 Tax=Rhodoferax koreensis TaxID=1842727 RepID=A0A1P8JRD3_9BURK|nr:PPK2 family polyphosphate kinase [Rhodoferax koreense]APW36316.1 polyphosphate--nucleotide phosphotransferase [Rhodoferax koreense]
MPNSSSDPFATLAAWQPAVTKSGKAFDLASVDPAAKPYSTGTKAEDKAAVETIAAEIDALQDIFFADKRFKLLVVLQGTDTAGKDGTVRGVFGRVSPLGVRTAAWKAPTEEERAHDILWRIHERMPGSGEIMVFNRSHYEDVLVPVVNGWITPEQTAERYRQLNDFERLLCESGTKILKFMLHISADEQRQRLQERIDDETKHWKFAIGDLAVRKQWADYQKAYAAMLGATSTAWAPWTVVPADSKTHRNLMIATVVRDTLKGMGLRYPPAKPELKGVKVV